MLNLFSAQGSSVPHTRAQTCPKNRTDLDDTESQAEFDQDPYLDSLIPTAGSKISALTEPRRTHQRSLTEYCRSPKDLPPLITPVSEPQRAQSHSRLPSSDDRVREAQPRFEPPNSESGQASPARSSASGSIPSDSARSEGKSTKIASWFQGESEPLKVGFVPSSQKDNSGQGEGTMSSTTPSLARGQQRKSASVSIARPGMASRFSFFSSKASLTKGSANTVDSDDEFLSMDPVKALIPEASDTSSAFSPAAFKNLQQQAEGLLSRLQKAYRERTQTLREVEAEKEVLAEETQGAETRAQHLKLQLDDLSKKLAEQDEAMMNLVDELAQEKLARREEEARKRTIRLVEQDHRRSSGSARGRISLSNTISDSGFESEDDSYAGSIFSGRNGMHSPTASMSSVSTNPSPETHHPPEIAVARLRTSKQPAFLKRSVPAGQADPSSNSYSTYNGAPDSEAWGVVSILKEENQCLKQRVEQLEGALDGCLDVVGKLGG